MRSFVRAVLKTAFRKYPFYSGCGTVANAPIFRWATRSLETRADVKLRNGFKLRVDPTEFLGRSVFFTREWDPKISWAIERILRPGDTFIDIGAHCGISSVIAVSSVGQQGEVHAFEPQPQMVRLLNETVRINGIDNLQVHEVALSKADGKANLHIQLDKPILASLSRNEETGKTISVNIRKTGPFLRSLHLKPIRLVKIDVEGHEIDLLNGSDGYFESENRPDAILFESINSEGPFRQRPVVRWLSELGYVFFALPKRFVRMSAHRVGTEADPNWHDFIAVAHNKNEILTSLNCK